MNKYQIWNKIDTIYTPSGKSFTPNEWIQMYQWINSQNAVPIISAGIINGSFIGELSDLQRIYEGMGADFSSCVTDEDKLSVIEAFEDAMNQAPSTPSAEERIASALEYQNLMSMPDVTQ